ncbi:MAG TPA: alpha/beta hydrolase [Thermoanaerobaculia bacterium]|nr:alpha/beta hydrolase [Thermoanaerobaculia bacterium]
MRLALLLAVLPLAMFLPGCVSLRPFSDVRREIPADRFVKVGDQLVHTEQAGAGEPILLIHGFGGSTYTWRKVMPALAESHRVVALDLNGFGYTQRPKSPDSYTREGQEKLVLGVMNALGIGRAHIFGHSYGGGLSLFMASRHPERFRSLVLVDSSAPTYANDRRNRAAAFRPLNNLFLRSFALRPKMIRKALEHSYYDDSQVTPELVQAYLDRVRIEGIGDAYYGLTVPVRTPQERVDLSKIDVPALVIWGAHDELISPAAGRRSAGLLPRGEFVLFANSGHLPMEEEPEEFLRVVLPFLERHRG